VSIPQMAPRHDDAPSCRRCSASRRSGKSASLQSRLRHRFSSGGGTDHAAVETGERARTAMLRLPCLPRLAARITRGMHQAFGRLPTTCRPPVRRHPGVVVLSIHPRCSSRSRPAHSAGASHSGGTRGHRFRVGPGPASGRAGSWSPRTNRRIGIGPALAQTLVPVSRGGPVFPNPQNWRKPGPTVPGWKAASSKRANSSPASGPGTAPRG